MMDSSMKAILSNRYYFSRGSRASDDYQQFWIRYKADRALRKLAKSHRRATVFIACAVSLFLLAILIMWGWQPALLAAVSLIGALVALRTYYWLFFPTHIALTEQGLQLHWLRSFCNISSPIIEWERLSHVSINRKQKTPLLRQSALEFNIVTSGIRRQDRLMFQLLAGSLSCGWLNGERSKVSMVLDAIASSDDRKRLQLGLKKFLPTYRIDPSVSEELNLAIRVETFTDLWLDALALPTRRLREDALAPGARILEGRYEVVCEIGAGGQAIVYEAIDRRLETQQSASPKVVLKEFILPTYAGANIRKRVLANIQREAELLKSLRHPNIVKLLEFFVEDQRAYIVLERIEGTTLKEIVEVSGPSLESDAIFMALQMCEILIYLHSRNVVHRDFTPDNLILGYGDILKLIDFNVAQQLEADSTKSVVGKHAYIPPEQFRGKACAQSDIYALGGTLYFLLTGQEPEPISVSIPRKMTPGLSERLDAIVRKATAFELSDRYEDCGQLKADLLQLRDKNC